MNIITTLKKFQFMSIFNFTYSFLNMKSKIIGFFKKMTINSIIMLNLKKKQPKINFIDLNLGKKFIYTIGLVLKILNTFKKSNRRVIMMIKNVITFVFKKHSLTIKNLMFVIKGFSKKLIKLIYMFKLIFNLLSFIYIKPLKTYKWFSLKKKRSIKRRIYKKLVSFSIK